MNENRIEELLKSYKESMGRSRLPTGPRNSPVARIALGAVAVGLLAGMFLWPRDASAAAVERIRKAIRNAHSMEMVFEMEGSTGFKEFGTTTYKDGAWRFEARMGTAIEGTYIVANGRSISDYKRLDHATSEPDSHQMSHMFPGAEVDALDFAMQQTDMGTVGRKRDIKLLPGTDTSTYKMRLERSSDGYLAEILVDRKTDLPISTEISIPSNRYERLRYRQTYKFNEQYPDAMFQVPKGKLVLDLAVEQSKLVKVWAKPLASIETTEVRDARISPDGTIWILVTAPSPPNLSKIKGPEGWEKHMQASVVLLPSELEASNGVTYARAQEIVPSAILSKPQTFKIDGDIVYIVPFVPLAMTREQPGKVSIRMATRLPYPVNFTDPSKVQVREVNEAVTVLLRKEDGALPSYFPALDLDFYGFQVPILLAGSKAKAFEENEDWEQAARAHEECARAYEGFIKNAAFRPLDLAAKCYEKAGMPDEAQRVRAEADALRPSKER